MGVWQGMAMDSLEYWGAGHSLPLFALRAATLQMALHLFDGWLPPEQAACGHLLLPWTAPTIRLRNQKDESCRFL
jgi:hypothetical protein